MSEADELSKLDKLRRDGALSEAEFATAKAKLLGQPAVTTSTPQTKGARPGSTRRRRTLLPILAIAVIVVIIVAVSSGSSGPSAKVVGKVTNVTALDSSTVRVYVTWTNQGKTAGSLSCALNTTVTNKFGDQVNIEVNSTGTNGNIQPGKSQLLYQDIGVNSGDAQFIKPSNVQLTSCS